MNTSLLEARATNVCVTDDTLTVELTDGRSISVPLVWYPRLLDGTPVERAQWQFSGGGFGIHWPYLDEDIRTEALLQGLPSREGPKTLQRWLDRRAMLRDKYRILDSLKTKEGCSFAPLEQYESVASYYELIEDRLRQLAAEDLEDLRKRIAYLDCSQDVTLRRRFLDCLAEVQGYVELKSRYGSASFIQRQKGVKTPDLKSIRDGKLVALMEVKYKRCSDDELKKLDEIVQRQAQGLPPECYSVALGLPNGLREALVKMVQGAVQQLEAYEPDVGCQRIVYLVAQLDPGSRDTPDIEALLREAVVPVLGDCELVLKIIP